MKQVIEPKYFYLAGLLQGSKQTRLPPLYWNQGNAPADSDAQQQLKDATQQCRGAWKGYQAAAD